MALQVALDECLSIRDGRLFVEELNACNFNALPRPGTILVNGDQAEWIKRPETVADVFQRDLVPERLRGPVSTTR